MTRETSRQVVLLYSQGKSYKQIGKELIIGSTSAHRIVKASGLKGRTSEEGLKIASQEGRLDPWKNKRPRPKT